MEAKNCILFRTPAAGWQQGCMLGNGAMGQVIYGRPTPEIVHFSHITFFSGSDRTDPYREHAAEAFLQAREAAKRGEYEEVSRQTERFMGRRGNYGTNLPAGRLVIRQEGHRQVREYKRWLDIDRGIAGCRYRTDTGEQKREAFTSHEDGIFAYLFEDSSPEGITMTVSYDGGRNPHETRIENGLLCFHALAREPVHSDHTEGVSLWGSVRVCAEGGTVTAKKDALCVCGAGRVVIYAAMETDFCLTPSEAVSPDACKARAIGRVNQEGKEYSALKERHTKDVFGRMSRQSLTLSKQGNGEIREKTAAEMINDVRAGGENGRLTELMYQFGRYLLLCSSREDSKLPAPLQGVWNDDVACRIGWTCDMHLDINTQMNYWISEPGNLAECHEPLFAWMEKRLLPLGRETARKCYGLEGWVGELVSNAWGYAAPYWNKSLSPCPTGGIWQASDYMEHFRYGQEPEFLKNRAFPVLSEAVDFFLGYLFEDGMGNLTCGPSISPENAFLAEGKKQYASNGCTYELLMIRELFTEYLELCGRLPSEKRESEKEARVKAALERLLPYRILEDGTLAEWAHDYPAADSQHRHTSHLLGLFPYSQITPDETPKLAGAAAASIRAKLTPYDNWEDTGWARSLLMLYAARLREEEQAAFHLRSMQSTLTGENLLVMHPPTRGTGTETAVYELDGNTGCSMSVMEMLLQSHNGCIRLLPALPKEWQDGSFCGFLARGGIAIDLVWEKGAPVLLTACSRKDTGAVFVWKDRRVTCLLEAGKKKEIHWDFQTDAP